MSSNKLTRQTHSAPVATFCVCMMTLEGLNLDAKTVHRSGEKNKERTDREVLVVSISMILISLMFLAVMLIVAATEKGTSNEYSVNSAVGWIAVVGAAVVFGSTGIPMKSPSLKTLEVESFVYSLYNSVGIFIATTPLILYKIITGTFYFEVYGILGAANILVVGYFAFMAVQTLGYAIAPALWCGVGMISAFVWGAVVFKEEVNNIVGGAMSILLLALGVYIMSTLAGSSTKVEDDTHDAFGGDEHAYDQFVEESNNSVFMCVKQGDEDRGNELGERGMEVEDSKASTASALRGKTLEGITYCLLTGLCDGAIMVPFKLSNIDSVQATFDYIVSFALASSFVAPVMFCVYCICRYFSGVSRVENVPIVSFHAKVAFIPGVLSGALWSLANFLSCHATFYLGMKIGFPLTQTCILFTTCWGIFYFREIDITPIMIKITFASGLLLLLAGSYVLSSFG